MKESRTTYSYLIEHMQEPSFLKVWDIAFDFVRKLPSDLCDELHESLNRGVDILDSEPLLQMYIYAFGKMHNAKLQYAFEHMQKNAINYNEVEVVDYGCGQGLATICYHDYLQEHNKEQKVKRVILIEPSPMALSRAELLCSRFYPNAEIHAINKQFDDLTNEDLIFSPDIPTIHLLSNILDVDSYDLQHFSKIVKEQSVGDNEYVLVSPMQNTMRIQRLRDFVSIIEKHIYFEQYLDKRQLDSEKEWTCVVFLCSQHKVFEFDCDKIFEDAKTIAENKSESKNEDSCAELFHKLQECARFGDKRCQNMLGIWYEKGIGIEQNFNLALEWIHKSAEQDYVSAFANLGRLYHSGRGTKRDLEKSVYYYTLGANLDAPDCQFRLALYFFSGEGVEKDMAKAFSLFHKAASHKFSSAIFELYRCYINGWGTEKDEEAALKALKEAAKLKHPQACYTLASYFYSGEMVEKDERKAFKLYKKSAELGYGLAQEKLGFIFRNGILGENESPKKSFKWYCKAAEQDNASAQFYIGYFYANGYGVKKNVNLAFEWYSKSAKKNNPAALNNIAICYEYGRGTAINLTKAAYYFEEAAKLGNITAQKNLAICYQNGIGVKTDVNKMFYWTLEAAKHSDLESQRKIAFLYFKGYGTIRSHEDSLVWYAKYYSKADNKIISNPTDAFLFFMEKAKENDAHALYVVGKCFQYGVATEKNITEAYSCFVKAAKLGHIESLIKVRQISALYDFCSIKESSDSIKDSAGVTYSKDKKILINTGYINAQEYKIADGTRIICDNAFEDASIDNVIISSSVLVIGKNPFAGYNLRRGRSVLTINCHSCNFIVSDSALYTKDKKKFISYFGEDTKFTIPQGVEVIGERAFADRFKLEEISFPDGLRCIENEAFIHCTRISKIKLPISVNRIGARCFYGCANLSEILSLGNVSIIKEGTFMGCNITMLTLPNSLVQIEDNAFNSNNELQNVKLPDSLREIGCSCFAYCGVSNILLNDNLQKIGDFCFFNCPINRVLIPPHVQYIGINPFIGAKHISCVDNENFVAENGVLYDKKNGSLIAHFEDAEIALFPPISRINSFAFYKTNVTDIFMGANIVDVEPWAFYQAEKLERIIWQKSRIKVIPEGCFGKCTNLCKISIPASVDEVKTGALFDTYELRKIRFEGGRTKANEKIFERIKRPTDIPEAYKSPYPFRGSTICGSYGRESLDFDSFTKIEIICPSGYSDSFSFVPIYNHDLHNAHESYGYGMDRTFILKIDEME